MFATPEPPVLPPPPPRTHFPFPWPSWQTSGGVFLTPYSPTHDYPPADVLQQGLPCGCSPTTAYDATAPVPLSEQECPPWAVVIAESTPRQGCSGCVSDSMLYSGALAYGPLDRFQRMGIPVLSVQLPDGRLIKMATKAPPPPPVGAPPKPVRLGK